MSDDPNDDINDDAVWTTGGSMVERLANAAGQSNSNKLATAQSFSKHALTDWQTHTSPFIRQSNKFARYFITDFPEWLKSPDAPEIEIPPVRGKDREIELFIQGRWAARVVVNSENPIRVYFDISKIRGGENSLRQRISIQADFRIAGNHMQNLAPSVYCFSLNGSSEYEEFKKILLEIWGGSDLENDRLLQYNNFIEAEKVNNPITDELYERGSEYTSGKTVEERLEEVLDQGLPRNEADRTESLTFEDWQKVTLTQINSGNKFESFLIFDFPNWLQETFGNRVIIEFPYVNRLDISINNKHTLNMYFNKVRPAFLWVNLIDHDPEKNLLEQNLSKAAKFKLGSNNFQSQFQRTYTMWLGNEDDYSVLKRL